jgi:hypothetical protein
MTQLRVALAVAARHLMVAAACAALACMAATGPAVAQTTVSGLSAVQLFEIAARAEAAQDAPTAETIYQALARDPDIEVRSEARFRHALLLTREKRPREAAVLLRAILDEKPDAQAVRLELAALLATLGDERAAYRELRQARAGGLPPDVVQMVDQFAGALRARKPYGASMELAFAPDSNINRATKADTLDTVIAPLQLSEDAQEQSGLGVRASGQVFVRPAIGKDLRFTARLSGVTNAYDQSAFNDALVSTQAGLEWTRGASRWSPSLGYSHRWYGGASYATTETAALNWRRQIGDRAQLEADLAAARARYEMNDLQDGEIYDASVSYERAFDERSGGSVSLSAQRQTARDPGYATLAGGLGVVYWREAFGATVYGTANVRLLESDARLGLFLDKRKETFWRLGAGATIRKLQFKGFSPIVRVSYERNTSTVGIYDYGRTAFDIGIARSF